MGAPFPVRPLVSRCEFSTAQDFVRDRLLVQRERRVNLTAIYQKRSLRLRFVFLRYSIVSIH